MDLDRRLSASGDRVRHGVLAGRRTVLPTAEMFALAAAVLLRFYLGVASLHVGRQGTARLRGGPADRRGVRREPAASGAGALGLGAAFAGVAGAFIALIYTLAPAQIYAWIGVVFAVVILGGLGNPLGPLVAGLVIGAARR